MMKISHALPYSQLALTVTLTASGWSGGAWASEATDSPDTDAIQEIVVTAQRREQKLSDVGMTVVADTGDSLIEKGISDITDLAKVVPGLTATETPYGSPVLILRGVGFYESALAGSSPVAAYIDEVPIPYTRMAEGGGLDIERVEISKGPQGTLYGQNSTGGAINYVTNKPTQEFHTGADLSYGRFNDTDLQGFVSGPISNTLEARLAVRVHESGAWQESVSRDATLGDTRFTDARLLVEFHPIDNLRFELNLNGFNDRSDTQAVQATSFYPNNPATVSPAELTAVLTPPGNDRLADWAPGIPLRRDNYDTQAALKIDYSVTDHLDVISITAENRYRQNQATDAGGVDATVSDATQDGFITSLSQELRLQGTEDRLKYVFGGNMSHDNIYDDSLYIVGDGSQARSSPDVEEFNIGRTYSHQHAETYSVFTDATFDITQQLNVDAGVRYTKQDRDFVGCLGDPGPIGGGAWAALFSAVYKTTIPLGGCTTINPATGFIGPVTGILDQSNVPWRVGLNYKVTQDDLLYASVSRGYKSGSFSTVGGAISTQYAPARQESLIAYEIGQKASIFSRRLEINTAIFYYDYSDKQFRGKIADPIFGTIEKLYNVPKSNIKGAEVQLAFRPFRSLTLDGNATYTKSEITSNFETLTPLGQSTNLQGQSFELTPTWAAAAGATYDTPLSASMNGFVSIDETYQSASHGGYGDDPIFRIDPYALMDANLGVRETTDRWRAELWVRNALDKYYWTNANYLAEYTYRFAGRPRTVGISFHFRY
jgi:iron complex outermembrane recepter protein